jgi:hypothetical protein
LEAFAWAGAVLGDTDQRPSLLKPEAMFFYFRIGQMATHTSNLIKGSCLPIVHLLLISQIQQTVPKNKGNMERKA